MTPPGSHDDSAPRAWFAVAPDGSLRACAAATTSEKIKKQRIRRPIGGFQLVLIGGCACSQRHIASDMLLSRPASGLCVMPLEHASLAKAFCRPLPGKPSAMRASCSAATASARNHAGVSADA